MKVQFIGAPAALTALLDSLALGGCENVLLAARPPRSIILEKEDLLASLWLKLANSETTPDDVPTLKEAGCKTKEDGLMFMRKHIRGIEERAEALSTGYALNGVTCLKEYFEKYLGFSEVPNAELTEQSENTLIYNFRCYGRGAEGVKLKQDFLRVLHSICQLHPQVGAALSDFIDGEFHYNLVLSSGPEDFASEEAVINTLRSRLSLPE